MNPLGPINTDVLYRVAPAFVLFSSIPKMTWMLLLLASFSIRRMDGPGTGSASSYVRSLQT